MINFRNYLNVTEIVIPNDIQLSSKNFSNAFKSMKNIIVSEFNHPSVTNIYSTYYSCYNLTGSPVCGKNVINMANAYYSCYNLTGSPICGNNVTNMANAYYFCNNLTGSPACSNSVTNMRYAYYGCTKLAGFPACGNSVTDMRSAYYNCYNLNAGTFYFKSNKISKAYNCFYNKNNSRRYNIHVPSNSITLNTFLINNSDSLVGQNITWTNAGTYYYNKAYNIYIYPNSSLS